MQLNQPDIKFKEIIIDLFQYKALLYCNNLEYYVQEQLPYSAVITKIGVVDDVWYKVRYKIGIRCEYYIVEQPKKKKIFIKGKRYCASPNPIKFTRKDKL